MTILKQQVWKAMAIFACAAAVLDATAGEIVVQQPPPLPGVYGGGEALACPPAVYPPEARRYELEGKLVVELLIGDDGAAHGNRIVSSSGWKILDDAAAAALAACRFSPITRDGKPAGAHWKKYAHVWKLKGRDSQQVSPPVLLRDSCTNADRLVLTDDPFAGSGVLMRFLTSAQGKAFGIKVEQGSGDTAIDAKAAQVLQACTFTPSQMDGKPVPGNAFARYRLDAPH